MATDVCLKKDSPHCALSKLPDHLHIDHKKKSITLQGFGEEKEMYGGKLYNGQVELKCNNLTFFLN